MSKQSNKPQQSKTGQGENTSNSSTPAIAISKKTLRRVLYSVPIILLAAIITFLFLAQPKRSTVFYANRSLVISDTLGFNHYIGAGNKVTIIKHASLIIHNDTIVVGDSIINLLCRQYLAKEPIEEKKEISTSQDTIILAEAKQDLELHSIDNHKVLFVKGKERFHVLDSMKDADSTCLFFNNIVFKGKDSDFSYDSLAVTDVNGFSENFKPEFVIRDCGKHQYAIRIKSNEENNTLEPLHKNDTILIYCVYGDKLLCKIEKTDTTYLFDAFDICETSDSLSLRAVCLDNVSRVLTVQEAVSLIVKKEELSREKSYSTLMCRLTYLLTFLFIVLTTMIIWHYYQKNKKMPERKELEERIKTLEDELQTLKNSTVALSDDPNELKEWFDNLDKQKGDLGLYYLCQTSLGNWLTALQNHEEDVNQLLSEFKENANKYIDATISISGDITAKEEELEKVRQELESLTKKSGLWCICCNFIGIAKLTKKSGRGNKLQKKLSSNPNDSKALNKKISSLEHELEDLRNKLSSSEAESARLRQSMNDKIKRAKEEAKAESDERVRKIEDRADAAERKSREIREEVTNQFKEKIQGLEGELKNRQNKINQTTQTLNQTKGKLKAKEQECTNLSRDLHNKIEALKAYSERITDVQPAGAYAKSVQKLLQIGHDVEKAADKLLEKGIDDYLLTKYITRYQKALHQLDMDQFATDVLNIANVQFVYRQQPLAKYDQYDVKKFRESMKLFFFESYLGKYIDALMVFNETMAGLHHLVDGLTESDAKVFEQCRKELNSVFKDLEIEVHSVKIFDSITDNVDLSVKMRPLDFNCPSGTICQIDSCLVYLAGGNKPSDKIHVIVKE